MKSIPRVIAGTAVVLAAVLTTAPLTAGIADYVLGPGQQPGKRSAAPATAWGVGVETLGLGGTGSPLPHTSAGQGGTGSAPIGSAAEDTEARLAELASDLQAGVEAGEYTQADAARVLSDLSSYIRGERTFPERGLV